MPRFRVTETRAYSARYIVEAVDEDAARKFDCDIVAEARDADDYGLEVTDVEPVDEEEEDA